MYNEDEIEYDWPNDPFQPEFWQLKNTGIVISKGKGLHLTMIIGNRYVLKFGLDVEVPFVQSDPWWPWFYYA